MSTLDELFPDGKHRSGDPVADDDHHTIRKLDGLLGDRRADVLDRTHRASARPKLVAMVNDAVSDARPLGAARPTPSAAGGRRRARIDVLNVAAAVVAVVAVVAAGIVGGVQVANASPAADALRVLTTDEKTIEGATAGLESAGARLAEAIAGEDAAAEALRPVLEGVREATDPADIPEGRTEAPEDAGRIPVADAAALDAVLGQIDAYRSDLAAYAVPAMPAAYTRGDIDTDSLAEVGSAIDAAQLQLNAIDRASAEVRTARTAVDARAAAFSAQLATFAATFPEVAKKAVDAYPDADGELKDAVAAAAGAIAASDLRAEGASAMLSAYRDAVFALAADQVQVERDREREEREEQERIERERQRPNPEPTDPAEGDPTTPPTEPTTPPDDSGSTPED